MNECHKVEGCKTLQEKGHHLTSLHAPRADVQAQRPEPFPFAIWHFSCADRDLGSPIF